MNNQITYKYQQLYLFLSNSNTGLSVQCLILIASMLVSFLNAQRNSKKKNVTNLKNSIIYDVCSFIVETLYINDIPFCSLFKVFKKL